MAGGDWPESSSNWFSFGVPRSVGLSANGFEYSGGKGGVKKDRDGGEYDGGRLLFIALPGLLILLPPVMMMMVRGGERNVVLECGDD